MYVAVKGGEKAIAEAHDLLAEERRGDASIAELEIAQIEGQLGRAVDRVMTEGSLYDRKLAALAIKQAAGDLIEAVFLVRAYRTTLPRFGYSEPLATERMRARRRISATFKDLPGGQVLGPTFDYTHRLLDFSLAAGEGEGARARRATESAPAPEPLSVKMPRVLERLTEEGLVEPAATMENQDSVADITREPRDFPAGRDARLQGLARGDEGYLLALAYSTQRGYGRTHPFAGEIRMGEVVAEFQPEELDFPIELGEVTITECDLINQFVGSATEKPKFTRGYGVGFGHVERKAMSMALVDRSLRAEEFDEPRLAPAQDQEFVLAHCDNVEAAGFVEHLKLPHYVDFQAELELLRKLRKEWDAQERPGEESAQASREVAE